MALKRNARAIWPFSLPKLAYHHRSPVSLYHEDGKTISHISIHQGTILEELGARKPWWFALCADLVKRRAGIPGRKYERARAETTESVKAAVNAQGYCWVVLDDHEDEATNGAARSICHVYTDGSIDFHIMISCMLSWLPYISSFASSREFALYNGFEY